MPPFIEVPGAIDPQFPPPYAFVGVHSQSFEFAANPLALQALCDTYLNIGDPLARGFVYTPLTSFVALEVNAYDSMTCSNPPFADGFMTQQEVYIRVWVAKFPLAFGLPEPMPAAVSSFFPFIFVDNSWSAFTGREVVGLAKQIGLITRQTFLDGSFSGSLELPVLKTLSPTTPQTTEQIARVRTGPRIPGGAPPGLPWPWSGLVSAPLDAAEAALVESVIALGLIDPNAFSTIQLKQFRDAQTPSMACYQALVSGTYTLSSVTAPAFYAGAHITFSDFPTMAIAAQLGLLPGVPIPATAAFSVTSNLSYDGLHNVFVV